MTAHFIQYIDIDRYKCFSDFSAHGFQRVNLIAGKNNVGKTALMEAMFINVRSPTISDFFSSLIFMYSQRKAPDYIYKKIDEKDASDNILMQANTLKIKTNTQAIEFKSNDSEIIRKYEINIDSSNNSLSEIDTKIFSIANKSNIN